MHSLFVYGSLQHRPLLDLVLGGARDARAVPATLAGHAVFGAPDQACALIVAQPGAQAQGLLVTDLSDEHRARLEFYAGGLGQTLGPVTVDTPDGPRAALACVPGAGGEATGAPWSLEAWQRDWAAISLRAATEGMALFGKIDAAELAHWLPQMRVRAAAWENARATSGTVRLRRGYTDRDVAVVAARRPYSRFFALEEQDLRFRRFDGGMSDLVTRAAFVSGDAVTVLPYDPARDRVLLIEQFRFGALVRGDRHPWSLEPIAGRVDPGETPEVCAHREAQEETGLTLNRLERIAAYYPSPGGVTEYIHSYVGIADLPDDVTGIGGVHSEAEDIRSLLLPFGELQALLASGEAENGPLILSAQWLAANRIRLRGDA